MSFSLNEYFKEVSEDFHSKFFKGDNPLICELHDILDKGELNHNCLACNIASSFDLIQKHLRNHDSLQDQEYAFQSTIIIYYLLVEKFFAIFKSIEEAELKPKGYKNAHKTMRLIWGWANFLKHPKAFMYVHDPKFINLGEYQLKENENNKGDENSYLGIENEFIKKYYMGGSKNTELYELIKNKTNVLVVYPDFKEINIGLKNEITEFMALVIEDNSVLNHLHKQATITGFWEEK